MIYTKEQFMKQNAFWQDKYYSYAIHITGGGAQYLFQVEGTRLTKKELEDMRVFRLDGTDIDRLCENLQKLKENKL